MARLNRQTLLLIGLFLLLLSVAVLQGEGVPARPFDPASREPDGLLLLREWLRELGYRPATTGQRRFAPGPDEHLLFVYPGAERFTQREADSLLEWVEAGGTAVLMGQADLKLRQALEYEIAPGYTSRSLAQPQPLLPQAAEPFVGSGRPFDLQDAHRAVTVLDTGGEEQADPAPVLAVVRRGQGWIWLVSDRFTFTNHALANDSAQAQLLPAFLRAVPAGGTVVFDTYHLFGPDVLAGVAPIESLQDWLYRTPTGWATAFLLLLGAGWLLLSGWRLGPALETVTQGRRREAAEFVVAMAGLQQRAQIRDSIARQQRQRLKQALGRPWRIPPDLPDGEFLRQLQALDPGLAPATVQEIAGLLAELTAVPPEERLLAIAQRVDELSASRRRQPFA